MPPTDRISSKTRNVIEATIGHPAMLSEEDEMSLRRWHNLLRAELTIALEKLSQSKKEGADKRLQHYAQCCAEQYWTIITRISA